MIHYYTAVEKFLVEHSEIQFTPNLINFEKIEQGALEVMANNLSLYRKSVNLPQAKMAKIFGVSLSQYKKYELGVEVLRVDLAQKWALCFSTPFFHLLQGCGYAENIVANHSDYKLNFIWFLANSLTDTYFLKLIDMLCLFKKGPPVKKILQPSRISRDDLKKVIEEIDNKMYIAIAYGLLAIRKHFNISQEQMAELLSVSVTTYQQYEKPTMKPRFSFFIASRYWMATGVNPLIIVAGTQYAKVRYMQDERMALVREIIDDIDHECLMQLRPLMEGFLNMAKRLPDALIADI